MCFKKFTLAHTFYLHYQQKVNTTFALYEVKWVLFKWVFGYVKVLPHSCQPDMFWPLMRPFKWGTAWSFISKDIRNTSSQIFGYPSLLHKVDLFWYFLLWLVVILMSLEVELHAVPQFKGLINGENISGRQQCGSTFT